MQTSTSSGNSRTVASSVFSALYAGNTTAMRLPAIISVLPMIVGGRGFRSSNLGDRFAIEILARKSNAARTGGVHSLVQDSGLAVTASASVRTTTTTVRTAATAAARAV